ncbi:MAG TPA: Ion transporter [Clostridiales bacterium]|nr:Ion transporter [Clostridiales bacterium]
MKNKIFNLIRDDDINDFWSSIFDGFIITLIIINVVLVILDTFSLPPFMKKMSNIVEIVSVIIFTLEYSLRIWTSDLRQPDLKPSRARWKYAFSFMALIDLFAILPFYIPFIISVDLRVLRMLRISRIFRLFKVNRYTNSLNVIASVFKKKASQLLSSAFVVMLLMIIASILMYNVEHEAQPDVFVNGFSGLWWAIATFTTVGYGDIYPITVGGRILSRMIAILLGIALVAVPTGIISAGFIEHINQEKIEDALKYIDENHEKSSLKYFCPYCGNKLE